MDPNRFVEEEWRRRRWDESGRPSRYAVCARGRSKDWIHGFSYYKSIVEPSSPTLFMMLGLKKYYSSWDHYTSCPSCIPKLRTESRYQCQSLGKNDIPVVLPFLRQHNTNGETWPCYHFPVRAWCTVDYAFHHWSPCGDLVGIAASFQLSLQSEARSYLKTGRGNWSRARCRHQLIGHGALRIGRILSVIGHQPPRQSFMLCHLAIIPDATSVLNVAEFGVR